MEKIILVNKEKTIFYSSALSSAQTQSIEQPPF